MLHFDCGAEVWLAGRFGAAPLSCVQAAAHPGPLQSVSWVAGVGGLASIFFVGSNDCSMIHNR